MPPFRPHTKLLPRGDHGAAAFPRIATSVLDQGALVNFESVDHHRGVRHQIFHRTMRLPPASDLYGRSAARPPFWEEEGAVRMELRKAPAEGRVHNLPSGYLQAAIPLVFGGA